MGTFIVGAILIIIVGLIVAGMIRDKKKENLCNAVMTAVNVAVIVPISKL